MDAQECSGSPPGCPGVVRRPSRIIGIDGRPSRMSGSGWESLEEVWEALLDVRE